MSDLSNHPPRREPAPGVSKSLQALLLLLSLCWAACGPIATLKHVTKGSVLATDAELQDVQVTRGERLRETSLGMPLEKGDVIVTRSGTEAVLELPAGYRVFLSADSELEILNPKLYLILGRAFVETLQRVREALKVQTEYTVAGVKGTRFLLTSDADGVVTCTVLEGTVTLESLADPPAWPAASYGRNQQVVIARDAAPQPTRVLRAPEIEALTRWVDNVRQLTVRVVPGLQGMTESEARRILVAERLTVGRVRYRITGQSAAGTVISQDPGPGGSVEVGSRVDLTVEKESSVVPDVTRRSRQDAERQLADARLRVGRTTEQLVEGTEDGVVLSQRPSAGSRVDVNAQIELTVAAAGVRIPDVRKNLLRQADAVLRRSGLQVGRTSEIRGAGLEIGTVVNTTPGPGTLVRRGSGVDLQVAAACLVPNLGGLTEAQARERLAAEQLRTGKVQYLELGTTVTSQVQPAGSQIACGSPVDFTIGVIG